MPRPLKDQLSRLLAPLSVYQGKAVLVGVSGGADSVALLRALVLAGALPSVAHLDHALRPGSMEDAQWVKALCEQLQVPCFSQRVDIAQVAQQRDWNLEDAARRIRYDFLTRTAKAQGSCAILTAHTRRDQAESVLMQLLRGEAKLIGMAAKRRRLERPWLDLTRPELEAFLHALGQGWCEDETNRDIRHTRAWLRLQVMPLLTARYPALEEGLARLAAYGQQDEEVLTAWAQRLTPHTAWSKEPVAVLRRWLAEQLRQEKQEFHQEHLDKLAEALSQRRTVHLTLPGGQRVTVTGGRLHLRPQEWPGPGFAYPSSWTLRGWQPGDRIRLAVGQRKLSDLLTEAHVPRSQRSHVPVLLDEAGSVQWVGLCPARWALGAREHLGLTDADPLDLAMREALALARQAAEQGEVPVGAVVLGPAGEIIGRGYNTSRQQGDMTFHAELGALREAAQVLGTPYLNGCTLIVTLEPCPMCLGAALEARVSRIVYGAENPKSGALGGVFDLLKAPWGHGPEVVGGLRAKEAARLLKTFFAQWRAQEQDR